ncbi:actin, putative [Theileria equi strain WA]|uniref:Actin, putative n=1 Tax=Theileria equi strain WA TaxID=1537102 RepID=L1LFY5_THEEQ|nr:actin, putative [Theileria equi strain WA]EKX74184.1 actin, putative [Theileria equi strain WA]|eukprot:XP_004833636.1 actin, putative [Theileria equi strain WA]
MEKPLILDYGTVSFRVGRAGDKNPSFLVPPVIGKPLMRDSKGEICGFNGGCGSNPLEYTIFPLNPRDKHDNVVPIPAITYGNNGFEVDEKVLERMLDGCMGVKGMDEGLHEASVIVSEPSLHNTKFRETFAEILSETFKVENLFLCKRSALTCYASASTSGIVVDVGGSSTNISPVVEGYTIQESVREEPIGGSLIDCIFYSYLSSIGITIRPSYEYCKSSTAENASAETDKTQKDSEVKNVTIRKLPFVHADYYRWSTLYSTSVLKETCIIFNDSINIVPPTDQSYCFALPDGNFLDVEQSKSLCGIFCSCIFNQKKFLNAKNDLDKIKLSKPAFGSNSDDLNLESILGKSSGLSNMLIDSWNSLSSVGSGVDLIGIYDRIIFTGGCTRHPALVPILQRDFDGFLKTNKSEYYPTYMSIGGNEQQYSSFIGASILASLGGFGNFCISRADIQEHGTIRSLNRKCP